jgi:hypothetical protein
MNVLNETSAMIQSYNNVLDTLMQNFRDGAVRDILLDIRDMNVKVHRIGKSSPQIYSEPSLTVA